MTRETYPTDVNDEQWGQLRPLIPPAKPGGRPRDVDMREVLNAILYVQRGGCGWRLLPHDLPPWETVYHYFHKWQRDGTWDGMLHILGALTNLPVCRVTQHHSNDDQSNQASANQF